VAVEHAAAAAPVKLMIFDVLWHEGEDVWRGSYRANEILKSASVLFAKELDPDRTK
jgi:hypothetical protein